MTTDEKNIEILNLIEFMANWINNISHGDYSQGHTHILNEIKRIKFDEVENPQACQYQNDTYTNCPDWQKFSGGCADCFKYPSKKRLIFKDTNYLF
jgi:hypothetical protein